MALLDDHASTCAQILIDLAPLNISEMREHLQHQLARQAHPHPSHRIPIRLSDDEYTRDHTAGQNLKPPVHDRIHRRTRTTRIAGSVGGGEQLHSDHEPRHQRRHRHKRQHTRKSELPGGPPRNRHQPARHHHKGRCRSSPNTRPAADQTRTK
ncbi:hypothetical protein ACFWAY_42615 [Rhodococcus sp. NPDC059968]|uniref:hypothetical protein n=1 Tax=Rhodococcus sp. NPDC059968 TaxID=3347017 RepID=UPI003673224D